MIALADISGGLKRHRRAFVAILMMPIVATTIALILIIALGDIDITILLVVIGAVLIQYLGLVAYIWRKLST